MQNSIQNFRQSSIVFEKPDVLFEKLKTLVSSNYHMVEYFLVRLSTHFLLTNIYYIFKSFLVKKFAIFCGKFYSGKNRLFVYCIKNAEIHRRMRSIFEKDMFKISLKMFNSIRSYKPLNGTIERTSNFSCFCKRQG